MKPTTDPQGNPNSVADSEAGIDVPNGWITDTYQLNFRTWSVLYAPEEDRKILYLDTQKICESENDEFAFEWEGEPVQCVRHLRNGFYELEWIQNGESQLSGQPVRSEIKGKRFKFMIAVYMAIAIWLVMNFRDTIGF